MAEPAFPRAVPAAWAEELPGLIAAATERWSLALGSPLTPGATAWVAEAALPDGLPCVLKVMWPHREGRYEADALRLYDGDGAIRLFDVDDTGFVLLLERCDPGTALETRPEQEQLDVAIPLLRRIWRPPPPDGLFEDLGLLTAEWADHVEDRFGRFGPGWDPGLVAAAAAALRDLPNTCASPILLHQDFHPGNVLSATREPWLVIDPKPVVGDPAYDAAKLVCHVGHPAGAGKRVDRLAGELALDRGRLVAWALARRMEEACWHLQLDNQADAADAAAWATALGPLL